MDKRAIIQLFLEYSEQDGDTYEDRIIPYHHFDKIAEILDESQQPQEGEREQILKPNHKCKPIAEAFMGKDRRLWIGELTEHIKEYPQEKYCLHIKTPVKDIVFLCNRGDFEQIYILAKVIGINPDKSWTESMVKGAKNNVTPPKG